MATRLRLAGRFGLSCRRRALLHYSSRERHRPIRAIVGTPTANAAAAIPPLLVCRQFAALVAAVARLVAVPSKNLLGARRG